MVSLLEPLGWAGWELAFPPGWRVYRASAAYRNGSLITGDENGVKAELTRAWVSRKLFNPEKVLVKQLGGGSEVRPFEHPNFVSAFKTEEAGVVRGAAFDDRTRRLLQWALIGDATMKLDAAMMT